MSLLLIKGNVSVKSYEDICRADGLAPEDKKVIFLFPGNSSHHTKSTTLFSIKSGGGLARVAQSIGKQGYPVLSLPTTSMEQWSTNANQQAIVQGAITDLYQALGAGYHFMLPVREHKNTQYFDHGLIADITLEPSFWGGIQAAPNKALANHYSEQLDRLAAFLALSDENRRLAAANDANNLLMKAYQNGLDMPLDDPWLNNGQKPAQKKPMVPKSNPPQHQQDESVKPKPEPQPSSQDAHKGFSHKNIVLLASTRKTYEKIYNSKSTILESARALLNDYTKNNSSWSLFFHGHWARHHVKKVNTLVKEIDEGKITTIEDLFKKLTDIKLVNDEGSLARRTFFLKEKHSLEKANEKDSAPGFRN